jgi:hypothetical protein
VAVQFLPGNREDLHIAPRAAASAPVGPDARPDGIATIPNL